MIVEKDNRLFIGGVAASELAKMHGTPVYAYDEETIRMKVRALLDGIAYQPLRIFYAAKANTNISILEIIRDEGKGRAGLDAVSPGEIEIALNAGFRQDEIIFTSTSVTDEEMKFAIGKGVLVNCDSLSQLERYGRMSPGAKVCFRVNPDVGAGHHGHVITGGPESKFGIWAADVGSAFGIVEKYGLKVVGIHEHIGSGILETEKFLTAMNVLLSIIEKNRDRLESLEFVDFGGGIGVPYRPDQKAIDFREFGAAVSRLFADFCSSFGRTLSLVIEPGRFLVAESGVLLCTVNTIKSTPSHKFVGVNTGFNHLIRPMAYGSYHPIVLVNNCGSGRKEKVAVCGDICESGDVFTRNEAGIADRELPEIREGDVLAIMIAGAYGFSMSSNYNTRPRPAEVLVSGNSVKVIRKPEEMSHVIYGMSAGDKNKP
ncbi:TPA: diaminopimelate decarboxylase [Candidatus Woesearchaeota archaeon]|nr:diaminopimelate decarboxylase [Candidatus Woesearchaeota archaeon]